MPKFVDRDERRGDIIGAVLRLIEHRGVESVTFRNVADEAGLSRGVIEHYFDDKDDLLSFTLKTVSEGSMERFESVDLDDRSSLEEAITSILPTTPESWRDAIVWVSLAGLAVGRPDFAAEMHVYYRAWIDSYRTLLVRAESVGLLPPGAATDLAANQLAAAIDGVIFAAILDPDRWPLDTQRQWLALSLDSIRASALSSARE